MNEKTENIDWLSRLRLWLNDPDRVYINHKIAFALYLPIMAVAIYGKLERRRFDGEASVDTLLLLAPEFIIYSLLIFIHILILRSIKSLSGSFITFPVILVTIALWFNFLLVEIFGNIYGITTSNTDFDYSLIMYSIRHMDGLFAVFMSVINPVIGLSALLLVFLYPLYLLSLIKDHQKSSLSSASGDKQAAILLLGLSVASGLYLAIVGTGHMQDVPLPIAISSIDRTLSTNIKSLNAADVAPIRQSYGEDAKLTRVSPDSPPPNLVVIVLESTRYLSTTGSELGAKITPYMNSLKDKSLNFDRAYAMVPHTSKSIESIYCSVEPKQGLALVSANPIVGIPSKCMAGFLKDIGYKNIFISTAPSFFESRDIFLKNAGFDEYILGDMMDTAGYRTVNYFGYEDKVMLPYVKDWLDTNNDKPFFMSLLTITPHHDYIVPAGFDLQHYSDDTTLNAYLNTLAYQDDYLKELISIFEKTGQAENTLFIIVGDHGEAFGEHDSQMHDTVLYDEGIRVPLMFFGAGVDAVATISKPVSLIDIMPTAFARMGFKIASDGKEIIGGVDAKFRASDTPVFSYCYREQLCSSMVKGDWKLIYHHGYKTNELYNLITDPHEKDNRAENDATRAADMENELTKWLASVDSYNRTYFKSKVNE